jgi:hypothetical protein
MSDNRDATKKARGFSYQRQYAIYYFLNFYEFDIKELIEEGKIDNKVYEDITLKKNDDKIITFQIKYHQSNNEQRFNRSSELFKTLNNENNFNNFKTYFIVSKNINNINTFDDNFIKLIDKTITIKTKLEMIYNLYKDDNKLVEQYNKCYTKFKNLNENDVLHFLDNFIIEEGFLYDELKTNINNKIKEVFNINDIKLIFYVKYLLFEMFDDNWFNLNIPININNEIYNIKNKIKPESIIDDIEQQNIIISKIIYTINNNLNKIDNSIDEQLYINQYNNIYNEIKEFIDIFNINIENSEKILNILHKLYLHDLYKKSSINNIKKLYKNICKILCVNLTNNLLKNNNYTVEQIKNFCKSINYYYTHNIKNKITLKNSSISFLL